MEKTFFKDLGLSAEILKALDIMGFETATEIQAKAIPCMREGLDIIGKSQTGTGKTLAFGIPAIEQVDTSLSRTVQVLVLCPTRELAVQATGELVRLAKFKPGIKVADVYGGAPIEPQISRLRFANIVVGTPGRIMDHLRRRTLRLDNVRVVVLDEADEMLSMGFRDDIETILQDTQKDRQTVLFSATMPSEILSLTRKYQKTPKLIEVNRQQVTVSNISQCYYNVPGKHKQDALCMLLHHYSPSRAIVFCNTKRMVDELTEFLQRNGFSAQGLHGDLGQSLRLKMLDAFKQGRIKILVATDVAARGIDVNDIEYVINYDIPQNTEYYVHRIGRTGRAGKSGMAITICCGRLQASVMARLAKLVAAEIHQKEMPSAKEIVEKILSAKLEKISAALELETPERYKTMAEELLATEKTPAHIVATLLRLHLGKSVPIFTDIKPINTGPSPLRSNVSGYKKISINIGKAKRVAPNHIMGALTQSSSITGKDIGKIEIFDNKTLVSVPAHAVPAILADMKNCKICGTPTVTKVHVTQNR